jgi:CubicO group peptidase (beta-lactamase class C family)
MAHDIAGRGSTRSRAGDGGVLLVSMLAAILASSCDGWREERPVVTIPAPPAGVDDLNAFLEEVRARHGLPGIAAAVFNADGLVAIGAAGTRRVGSEVPLIFTDRLPIASMAKTMTATITAQLIERGLLTWETTLGEIYPELHDEMQPVFRAVTVDMLLRHSAGLPRWMRHDDVVKEWVRTHRGASNMEMRHAAVRYMLSHPPETMPGARYSYTNDAFLILGSICEKLAGKPFEELLREQLFQPLGMSSCGFGEPWSARTLEHPWGHVRRGDRFVPYEPDPDGYGTVPFGNPYGAIVHGSVVDLARYGAFHLRGDLGLEPGLTPETWRRLHHAAPTELPPATEIPARGFFNEGRADAEGRWTNVQHWGYYARGRTLLWFSPQANVGAVVLTNGTDEDEVNGMRPVSEIVIALFTRYRAPPGP